ncbi:MAG: VCBS repeat-containing protein [Bacteroidetes bacterium]|nr:MAG: VCBS repeat-containing protein [Bacteroidota bacterium]
MPVRISFTLLIFIFPLWIAAQPPVSSWAYHQIDSTKGKWGDEGQPDWLRYFGLDMGDIDQDGDLDILSGRYLYRNPGGNMKGEWSRIMLPQNVDGILFLDVDGDTYADLIAQALPDLWWFEAEDHQGSSWSGKKIGTVPATSHVNSQGFGQGQFIPGGKEEFVIAGAGDVYLFQIPQHPDRQPWPRSKIGVNTSDEGIGLGDIDGDGDLDIACGRRPPKGEEPLLLLWFENPGHLSSNWANHNVGQTNHPIDRVEVGDLNGDGRADIAVTEERWPGLEPDANLFWFEQPLSGNEWPRHHLVTQYSMNNLDLADIDQDGDPDLLTAEHKGPRLEVQLWENNGTGHFTKVLIDTGKENHLGTRLADLDQDGDLDLVGAGWDQYQQMHIWRNDYIDRSLRWRLLSTATGELPPTNGSNEQTASLVADVTGDGIHDIFITDRTVAPAVIGLFYTPNGWKRHIIEAGKLRIEAGSPAHDIDGDGDTDIVFAGEAQSNEVWWWENPYPAFHPQTPWKRHTIKRSGGTKHHDQAFIDYDGDGQKELVFWNQGAQTLFVAEIPANPSTLSEWDFKPAYTYTTDGEPQPPSTYPSWRGTNEHEGLFPCDIDGDGIMDIVGGGRWFKYQNGTFLEHLVDPAYAFTRAAAGQLIVGGRPELVFVVGDGVGPLILYEWQAGYWQPRVLLEEVNHGHTLDVLDVNGDGYLDIFNAEMRFGEGNPDSEIRILLGDGQGHFRKHVVARGYGVHEGKLVDLDGDGDYDVLGKPYTWKAPLLNIWLQE